MRYESMLGFVLLAVAAAPCLAYPVEYASRELDADVYERDVADGYDFYAREDNVSELYEREDFDLEARGMEDLSDLIARAVDEVLYARATNGQGNHGAQGNQPPPPYSPNPPSTPRPKSPPPAPQYNGPTKPSQSTKVKKLPTIHERDLLRSLLSARATNGQGNHGAQGNQPPPPYQPNAPPKPRPDSPRPAPQYNGPTKSSQSTKVKKLPKVQERDLLRSLLSARATNGQGNHGTQGNQPPPPYQPNAPPKPRPDSPRPAPQYNGPTKSSQSTKVKKLPKVKERSFVIDWDMDLD